MKGMFLESISKEDSEAFGLSGRWPILLLHPKTNSFGVKKLYLKTDFHRHISVNKEVNRWTHYVK